jgi:hypothetical protein
MVNAPFLAQKQSQGPTTDPDVKCQYRFLLDIPDPRPQEQSRMDGSGFKGLIAMAVYHSREL